MKRLSLLLLVCMVSMLAFAQPGSVTLSPSSPVDLGNQAVLDSPSIVPFILHNGGSSGITISKIPATTGPGFSVSANYCPLRPVPLAGGAKCIIYVAFQALSTGPNPGTLSVTDTAGTQTASLHAVGVHDVTLEALANCNGEVYTAPCKVRLVNQLTTSLKFNNPPTLDPAPDFYLVSNDCTGHLDPLSSCTFEVEWGANDSTFEVGTLTVNIQNPPDGITSPTQNLLGCRGYCQGP